MILVSALGHCFHRKQQRKTGMVTSCAPSCAHVPLSSRGKLVLVCYSLGKL